jgi:hypothetical protein
MLLRQPLSSLWCCALLAGLAAPSAHAQDLRLGPQEVSGGDNGAPPGRAPHPRGGYNGVKPGGGKPPEMAVKPGTKPATITWPGFAMQPDGSSRVFLESTVQVGTQAAISGDKVVVDLGEVRIASRTNRFPLVTNFFNTPVTRVELKHAKKRVLLELTLRAHVEPRISSEQAKSGFYFVYIDFPAGNYAHAPAAIAADSAPPAPEGTPPSAGAVDHFDDSGGANAGTNANMSGNVSAGATIDEESPPGIVRPKAGAKTKTKVKFGAAR